MTARLMGQPTPARITEPEPTPTIDPRTGARVTPVPLGKIPILDAPAVGLPRMVEGGLGVAKALGSAAQTGPEAVSAAPPTDPNAPLVSEATLAAASEFIEGLFQTASPLIVGTGIAAPIPTGAALLKAHLAGWIGEQAAEELGATPEASRLAGNVGALLSGTIDAKNFAQGTQRDVAALLVAGLKKTQDTAKAAVLASKLNMTAPSRAISETIAPGTHAPVAVIDSGMASTIRTSRAEILNRLASERRGETEAVAQALTTLDRAAPGSPDAREALGRLVLAVPPKILAPAIPEAHRPALVALEAEGDAGRAAKEAAEPPTREPIPTAPTYTEIERSIDAPAPPAPRGPFGSAPPAPPVTQMDEAPPEFHAVEPRVAAPPESFAADVQTVRTERPEPPSFASTQVALPSTLAERVRALAGEIPDDALAPQGREDEPHVTVKYGIHTRDVAEIRRVLEDEPPVRLTLGALSTFPDQGQGEVLKADVVSDDLQRLHDKITKAVETTDTHPEYQPHVTIAYLKPGLGTRYVGRTDLEGEELTIDRVTFSTPEGDRVEIALGGKAPKAARPQAAPPTTARPAEDEEMIGAATTPARRTFFETYLPVLREAHATHSYPWPIEQAPQVAEKMATALEQGTANTDSSALKRAAKKLGIKNTLAAWREFFQRAAPPAIERDEVKPDTRSALDRARAEAPAPTGQWKDDQDVGAYEYLASEKRTAREALSRRLKEAKAKIRKGEPVKLPTGQWTIDNETSLLEAFNLAVAKHPDYLATIDTATLEELAQAIDDVLADPKRSGLATNPALAESIEEELKPLVARELKKRAGQLALGVDDFASDLAAVRGQTTTTTDRPSEPPERTKARREARAASAPFNYDLTDWANEQLEMGADLDSIISAVREATSLGIDPTRSDDLDDLGSFIESMEELRTEDPDEFLEQVAAGNVGKSALKQWAKDKADAWDAQIRSTVPAAQTGVESEQEGAPHAAPSGPLDGDQLPEPRGAAPDADRAGGGRVLADVPARDESEPGQSPARPRDTPPESVVEGGVRDTARAGEAPGPLAPTGGGDHPAPTAVSPTGASHDPGHQPLDYALSPERIAAIVDRGPVQRAKDNLAAIQLVKALQAEQRWATPEEQDILAKYVGWGDNAVAAYLNDRPAYGWSANENRIWEQVQTLSAEERKALRASTTNAHFTFDLYGPIWEALTTAGFGGGRVLEPAVGVGHALGMMPATTRAGSTITAVELEPLSAAIAGFLYPSATVQATGFQTALIPRGTQDVAISNVPFAKTGVSDPHFEEYLRKPIQNYFFAKALDYMRPGGIIAFITSRYTLDAPSHERFRRYLMDQADFLGAVRLPSQAFDKTAKTEVVTDIILLRKREAGVEPSPHNALFITSEKKAAGERNWKGKEIGEPVYRSTWYDEHPDLIVGEESLSGTMYRSGGYNVSLEQVDTLQDALRAALAKLLPTGTYRRATRDVTVRARVDLHTAKVGELRVSDDGAIVVVNNHGELEDATPQRRIKGAKEGEPQTEPDPNAIARVKGLISIRDARRNLVRLMRSDDATDADIKKNQRALGALYDQFVKLYGTLNSRTNKMLFAGDPDAAALLALEKLETKAVHGTDKQGRPTLTVSTEVTGRADIFRERTVHPTKKITSVSSPKDALMASLGERAGIDWPFMQDISGAPAKKLQAALIDEGLLYEQPDGSFVLAEEYLSGDVVTKLEDAKAAGKRFKRNVEALTPIQPAPKTRADILDGNVAVTLGAGWIDPETFADFATTQLGHGTVKVTSTRTTAIVKWHITADYAAESAAERHPLHVPYANKEKKYSFLELLEDTLNLQAPTLGYYVADGKTRRFVREEEPTLAARANQDSVRDLWLQYLYERPELQDQLLEVFNTRYNRVVERRFDGSHLRLPGKVDDSVIKFHAHQMNAVWRILTTGNTLLAHEVGAGKTFEMIAAAMEMKRTGRAAKPMIVVPTYLIGQWRKDVMTLYPDAKLLAFDEKDLAADRRKVAMARIANGNWDIVLVPHSSFGLLSVSPDRIQAMYDRWLGELEAAIKGADEMNVKQLERVRSALQDKVNRVRAKIEDRATDNALTWEELGVDALFIDEAHAFKNLFFFTEIENIRGLSRSSSDRAIDLFVKVQEINEQSRYRNLVLATATPMMNSMAEVYTMQRYLQPQVLEQAGLSQFDLWYAMFAKALPSTEQQPDGSYKEVMRIRDFRNLQLLSKMVRQVMDYVGWEDMPYLDLPAVAGGKVEVVEVQPHPMYPKAQAWFKDRMENIGSLAPHIDKRKQEYVAPMRKDPLTGAPMGVPDNILTIMNDAKKAAVDIRLIFGDRAKDFPGSRVQAVADRVAAIYKAGHKQKLTQLLFLDMGTPKDLEPLEFLQGTVVSGDVEEPTEEILDDDEEADDGTVAPVLEDDDSLFNLYGAVKRELERRGIPSREMAFIHQAQTGAERTALFDAMNAGTVRVLFASTDKGGVGMNVQKRLVAIHEIDAPRAGRPGDLRQRMGRGIRQGNMNKAVRLIRYVTKGSTDEWLWGMLVNKDAQIQQFMKGKATHLLEEDLSSKSLEEAQMRSSGDPRGIELVELKGKRQRLAAQAAASASAIAAAKSDVKRMDEVIRHYTRDKQDLERWAASQYQTQRGDQFSIRIGRDVFTKREEANTALLGAIRRLVATDQLIDRPIGELGNLPIVAKLARRVSYRKEKMLELTRIELTFNEDAFGGMGEVVSALEHFDGADLEDLGKGENLITQIVNAYERIPTRVKGMTAQIEEAERKKAASEAALAAPARSIAEHTRVVERIAALEKELKLESEGEQELDAEGKPKPKPKKKVDEIRIPVKRKAGPKKKAGGDGATASLPDPATQTPEFRAWFKGSKIVDWRGDPLVVYHGTRSTFTTFRVPAYFAVTRDGALEWAANSTVNESGRPKAIPVYLSIKNPVKLEDFEDTQGWGPEDIRDYEAQGYDGAVLEDYDATIYIAFRPEQIKHATKNRGTFSADDPSILAMPYQSPDLPVRPRPLEPGPELPVDAIVKELSVLFDRVPVSVGHFRQQARGIYKIDPQAVRTRVANDLYAIAHEFGHHLDITLMRGSAIHARGPIAEELKRLGAPTSKPSYSAKQRRQEGAAEFFRIWLLEPERLPAQAPKYLQLFEAYLVANPPIHEGLLEIRNLVQTYLSLSPVAQAKLHVDMGSASVLARAQRLLDQARDAHARRDAMTYLSAQWVDDLAALNRMERDLAAGRPIDITQSAYVLARLARGSAEKAEGFLRFGVRSKTGQFLGTSFDGALATASHDLTGFSLYAAVLHAAEMEAEGLETGFTGAQIRAVIDQYKSPEFDQAIDNLREYHAAMRRFLVESGVLSPEQAKAMAKRWRFYVPSQRVRDDRGRWHLGSVGRRIANQRSPIKRKQGSGRRWLDPLESIIRNTHQAVAVADRNRAMQALVDLVLSTPGSGSLMEEIPTPQIPIKFNLETVDQVIRDVLEKQGVDLPQNVDLDEYATLWMPRQFIKGSERFVTVLDEGRVRWFEVHDEGLYDAITAIGPANTAEIVKLFWRGARALRAFATTTLGFILRNPVRDVPVAMLYSRAGFTPLDFLKGLASYLRKDEDYQLFLSSGAGMATLVASDRDLIQRRLKDLGHSKARQFLNHTVLGPVDGLRALSSAFETATRLGEFRKTLAKMGRDEAGLMQAGLNARDVTQDFAMAGRQVRAWNQYVAFFSANVGGYTRLTQALTEGGGGGKRPTGAGGPPGGAAGGFGRPQDLNMPGPMGLLWRALPLALFSLLLWILHRGDEDYDQIPAWERNAFWHVPTPEGYLKIVKPFQVGVIFGTSVEAFLEYLVDRDPAVMERLPDRDSAKSLILTLIPTALLPWVQVGANYDFFRDRAIVSPFDVNLDPELQYNRHTTETAKRLGKWLHWSPAKIESVLYGYTAAVGRGALQATDVVTGMGRTRPATDFAHAPIVGTFYRRVPLGDAQAITSFYDARDQLNGVQGSMKRLRDAGNLQAALRLQQENAPLLARAAAIRHADRSMTNLRRQLERIYTNQVMTPDQKRTRIDQVERQMLRIAQTAIGIPR